MLRHQTTEYEIIGENHEFYDSADCLCNLKLASRSLFENLSFYVNNVKHLSYKLVSTEQG